MASELEKFYELVYDIDTAMMTTRRADGHLRSRAMANQKRAGGADLWFVCREGTAQARRPGARPAHQPDLLPRQQPRVGLGVGARRRSRGIARRFASSTQPDWKIWFPDEGDPRHGTPDDPRIVLIGVDDPRRRVPRSEQAAAGASLRAGQGLADRHRARAGQDARDHRLGVDPVVGSARAATASDSRAAVTVLAPTGPARRDALPMPQCGRLLPTWGSATEEHTHMRELPFSDLGLHLIDEAPASTPEPPKPPPDGDRTPPQESTTRRRRRRRPNPRRCPSRIRRPSRSRAAPSWCNPAMPTITTRDGVPLYVKDWGTGRPVVLMHGWPLSADTFD